MSLRWKGESRAQPPFPWWGCSGQQGPDWIQLLSKCKRIEIISRIFSDYNSMKLEMNTEKETRKKQLQGDQTTCYFKKKKKKQSVNDEIRGKLKILWKLMAVKTKPYKIYVVGIQSLSHVQLFATPIDCSMPGFPVLHCLRACSNSSIELMMPSNHLILCHLLLLLPLIFPSISVFSNELALDITWPKYYSFSSASVLPINIQGWYPLGLTSFISLQSKGLSRVSNTTI